MKMNLSNCAKGSCVVILSVATALCAFADFPKNLKPGDGVYDKNGKKLSREEVHAILYRRNGGKLKVPGIQKGSVSYVICGDAVQKDLVSTNAAFFAKKLQIEVAVSEGSFDWPNPKIHGDASIFIVSDAKLPSLLVAPEQKWTMVNVAPLKAGRGEKLAFYNARIHKELTRGFAMLCGATASNYPQSITGCVVSPEDLDKFPDAQLPVDVVDRFADYLKGYGVVPYQLKTYRQACAEGWAPEPNDEIRKAIWDEFHNLPTAPVPLQHQK